MPSWIPLDRRVRNRAAAPRGAWTVGRLLTWTTDYLKRRGSESPRLDAEVMLAHVLEWQRVQLYTHFTDEVRGGPRGRFRDLVRRRVRGRARRLPRRAQGVLFPALRGLAGRADPAPESEFVVVEFLALTKAPRVASAPWTWAPARAAWRSPRPTSNPGPGSWPSTSARRPWPSPARTPPSTASPTASTSGSATSSSRSPARALRRDHLQPAVHPDRRDRSARARRPGLRAAHWPSTAAPTASTWSRG